MYVYNVLRMYICMCMYVMYVCMYVMGGWMDGWMDVQTGFGNTVSDMLYESNTRSRMKLNAAGTSMYVLEPRGGESFYNVYPR